MRTHSVNEEQLHDVLLLKRRVDPGNGRWLTVYVLYRRLRSRATTVEKKAARNSNVVRIPLIIISSHIGVMPLNKSLPSVRPNGLSLSCTAGAHVPKPTRHAACRM